MQQANVIYKRRGGTSRLALCGVVDIFDASALRESALECLRDQSARARRIDLAKGERIDLSALQILLALRRGLRERAMDCQIAGVSAALAKKMDELGIEL